MILLKTFLFSIYLFTMMNFVQAEIYKCKDRSGVVNFTSVPCGQKWIGIKHQENKIEFNEDGTKKTRKQILDERMKKEKEFLKVSKREREDKENKRKKLEQHQNEIKQNCAKAKNDLNNFQNARRIYKKDKSGQQQVLSDDERKKSVDGAQRRISYWCR